MNEKGGQEEIENLNRAVRSKEIESVIKNIPRKRSSRPDGFIGEFQQSFSRLKKD